MEIDATLLFLLEMKRGAFTIILNKKNTGVQEFRSSGES
jgi:hypothetical protein